jgi:sugar phosphate isomerase/epimerase
MCDGVELMTLFWTTSGVFPGVGEISRFDFRDRVEAAARAGFTGVGIWHTDLEHILRSRSLEEIRTILDDNGIKHLELEFLTNWFLTGRRKIESDTLKRRLLDASQALGAKHIKIGDFDNTPCPFERIVDAFAALCDEAQAYRATIGFEFMRSATIDNWADSVKLVEQAGADNGGLILDSAHVYDLGITLEQISTLPLQYLVNVELNDGTFSGSPIHDPSRARRFCGEGEYDLEGLIDCVRGVGYTGPWAVEVFSEELAGLPLEELNSRAYETTMALFEA